MCQLYINQIKLHHACILFPKIIQLLLISASTFKLSLSLCTLSPTLSVSFHGSCSSLSRLSLHPLLKTRRNENHTLNSSLFGLLSNCSLTFRSQNQNFFSMGMDHMSLQSHILVSPHRPSKFQSCFVKTRSVSPHPVPISPATVKVLNRVSERDMIN